MIPAGIAMQCVMEAPIGKPEMTKTVVSTVCLFAVPHEVIG